jgi:3-oxoacyl-[acyl-carrier protein] reductase
LLNDKVALITGAGRGIGSAIARRFAREGARVVCVDIVRDLADETAQSIASAGGTAVAEAADVADKAQVEELVKRVTDRFDRLDILVNNAGVTRDGLAMRMKEEDWDLVMRVNLRGTFIPCQAVIRPMRKNRWGRIVNTASIAALGNTGQANYSASKGGVISLTRTLALELAASGITVNCVAPGAIMTPMLEAVSEDLRRRFLEHIPLGRFGTPDDVASAHLFLCSDDAAYITGQSLFIDGGMSVGM